MTVASALALCLPALAAGGDSPRTDARLLLAHVLGRERAWLLAHDDSRLSARQSERFRQACARRAAGTPVAYIIGRAGFFGREFAVDERVLIPRPETELLVEEALAYLRGRHAAAVLDVGTGSGAIACTIAAEDPDTAVEGTDTSAPALAVARRNAERLGVRARCRFLRAEIAPTQAARRYDVLVANLPYVPTGALAALPDPTAYEPRAALDGGPDGLRAYRKLLAVAGKLLRSNSLLLMEAAPPTVAALAALTAAALPTAAVEVGSDYSGMERYVRARLRG